MDNSISFHVFVSKQSGNQISLDELAIVRARLNEFCQERGLSMWSVASESAAEQSVHWIGGESAPFKALSTPEVLSIAQADTTPPANQ